MTLQEFDIRMIQEEKRFLGMCLEAGIWDTVADRVLPTRARAFAEALSLDLSVEATRARIQADPAGAAAVCEVVQAQIHDRKNRKLLAERLPSGELTPCYVMSAFVLDVSLEELEEFERMHDDAYSLADDEPEAQ